MENKTDLKKFLNEHFVYEANALYYAIVRINEINQREYKNQDEENLVLESFLFHSRNLIEFFFYKTNSKNYARAADFINNKKWDSIKLLKTRSISEVEDRANKEIVHLTYDRISGSSPEKNWNLSIIFGDLLKVIKIFLNDLPTEYCGKAIDGLKSNINQVKGIL